MALLEEKARRTRIREAEAVLEAEAATTGAKLSTFVKAAWHVLEPETPLVWGWALDAICRHLEAISRGQINRLVINVPPGMMKSLITSVFWPAWEWGPLNRAGLRYVGVSHSDSVANRDNLKMRRLVESEWYRQRWPHVALVKRAEDRFDNTAQGFRVAVPAGSVTGERGNRLIIDDPIAADAANSDAALGKVERWFREAARSRLNDPDGDTDAIVVIMQRLHERDLSGVILDGGFDYVHLCLPMEFESERRCETLIGFADPRTEDGALLFPERFSREWLEREKPLLGEYGVAGQLQQNPTPRGGAIFKEPWFIPYGAEVAAFLPYTGLPQLRYRMIFADTAQKPGEENDYSVFQCWGAGSDGCAYLIDQIRGKWEAPELRKRARAFWRLHKERTGPNIGHLRGMRVEDKVSGTGLIQDLRSGDPKAGEPAIPVTGIPRPANKNKITRAYDCQLSFESGLVRVPAKAPWYPQWKAEMKTFPKAAHDDQVDVTMDAVTEICGAGAATWAGAL